MSKQHLLEYKKYADDPWLFLSECVFTKDQVDQKNPIKQFPAHWDYLRVYTRVWQKHRLLAVPKSRRMTMSWTNIALYLHSAMFFPTQDFAFVSKKEDDAAELVARAEFIYDHIPEHRIPRAMLPKKDTSAKPPSLKFPEIDSKIQGFPQGADQLRQFTFSGILGDECAFWDEFTKFYAAAIPTTEGGGRCTLISSRSPGGFQRVVYDQLDNSHEIDEEETPPQQRPFNDDSVIYWENPKNRFAVFDIHYTANPGKRSVAFREGMKGKLPIKEWMVEYERNWEAFAGKAVFEDYSRSRHESRTELEPWTGLPLLCGWDFGHTPACVIAQLQGSRLVILREYVSKNKGIRQFAPIVMAGLQQHYPDWRDQKKDFIHYIDPAGLAKSQHDNEKSCATELSTQGFKNIFPGPTSWEDRRRAVEHFLLGQTKEGSNLVIDPKACPTLAKGFAGGYQYPERYAQVEPKRPEPIKNSYSHPHDALQYLAGGAMTLLQRKPHFPIPSPQYSFTGEAPINEAEGDNRSEYHIGGSSHG